jgi:hypothetical protein
MYFELIIFMQYSPIGYRADAKKHAASLRAAFEIDRSSQNARKVATKAARFPKRLAVVLAIWGTSSGLPGGRGDYHSQSSQRQ